MDSDKVTFRFRLLVVSHFGISDRMRVMIIPENSPLSQVNRGSPPLASTTVRLGEWGEAVSSLTIKC